MGSYNATWEDEDNNRQIQFSVAYASENGSVEIAEVTPTKVSFLCPDTNTCLRAINVHTNGGRSLLAQHIRANADFDRLEEEIVIRAKSTVIA